jgi:hypothetical protein
MAIPSERPQDFQPRIPTAASTNNVATMVWPNGSHGLSLQISLGSMTQRIVANSTLPPIISNITATSQFEYLTNALTTPHQSFHRSESLRFAWIPQNTSLYHIPVVTIPLPKKVSGNGLRSYPPIESR